jgi:hypothetical protein
MLRGHFKCVVGVVATVLLLAVPAGSAQESATAVLAPGETPTIIATPENLAEFGPGAAAIAAKQGIFQHAAYYSWGAVANYAKSGLLDYYSDL